MAEEELAQRLEYLANLMTPAIPGKSADSQRKTIEKFNRAHRILEFPPGGYVMTKGDTPEGNLWPKYNGPYKGVARTKSSSCTLLDATNAKSSRNFTPEQLKLVSQAPDAPSDESYEV